MDFGPCVKCKEKADIRSDGEPLCGTHFVEKEDPGCLAAFLDGDLERGTCSYPPNIQRAIKKLRPQIYEEHKRIFEV